MPKQLYGHGSVKLGVDFVVIGGKNYVQGYSSSLYKMSCYNHYCIWDTMHQTLKNPRAFFVAMTVPKESVTCQKMCKFS